MATLFALVYPDRSTAEQALETARELERAGLLEVVEHALVTRDENGDLHVDTKSHPVVKGAGLGAALGGLAGWVVLMPLFGAAAGASAGALIGKAKARGASARLATFEDLLARDLLSGGAAVLLLVDTAAQDQVVQALAKHGGMIYSHDLTPEQLDTIQAEIDRASEQEIQST